MTYNLVQKRLDLLLLVTLFFTLFSATRLLFFPSYLICSFYQRPLIGCLLRAMALGLLLDLLSSDSRFGITALNYFLCTLLLYPQKRHFFSDRLSTLPIMTFFFATLSAVLHYLIQLSLEKPVPLTLGLIGTDLLLMPLFDALTAFLLFIAPPLLLGKRVRKGKDYFFT